MDWSEVVQCDHCGAGNPCDADLCTQCGEKLDRSSGADMEPDKPRPETKGSNSLCDFMLRKLLRIASYEPVRLRHRLTVGILAVILFGVCGAMWLRPDLFSGWSPSPSVYTYRYQRYARFP